jgi:HEPN domain-containing protein
MHNRTLAADYLARATHRLAALDVRFDRESWADVVRESQEAVELALKSLFRFSSIEVPQIHDVGQILLSESSGFRKRSGRTLRTWWRFHTP